MMPTLKRFEFLSVSQHLLLLLLLVLLPPPLPPVTSLIVCYAPLGLSDLLNDIRLPSSSSMSHPPPLHLPCGRLQKTVCQTRQIILHRLLNQTAEAYHVQYIFLCSKYIFLKCFRLLFYNIHFKAILKNSNLKKKCLGYVCV